MGPGWVLVQVQSRVQRDPNLSELDAESLVVFNTSLSE